MSTVTAPPRKDGGPSDSGPPAPAPKRPARSPLAALLRPQTVRMLPAAFAVLIAVVAALATGSDGWPEALHVDVRTPLGDLNDWLVDNRDTHPVFLYFLLHLSNNAESAVDGVYQLLSTLGWVGVLAAGVLLAWYAAGADAGRKALRVAATALAAFAVCGLLGVWDPAMETLALMTVAVAAAALVGLLLGLGAGLFDRCERALRPVFDTMQVMPAFAYLLPFVLIFGIGTPSALFATVIYAAPPMARLTSLGLRQASPGAMEASASLGAGWWQQLITARLPLARKQILLGLNQTIMMSLSMVVIASVIGAGGLGDEVFRALSTVNVGEALSAGIAIVMIAIWLDRTTAAAGARLEEVGTHGPAAAFFARLHGRTGLAAVVAATVALAALGRSLGEELWPKNWTVDISPGVNTAVSWFTDHLGYGVPLVGGTLTWADGFTNGVLNPMRAALLDTPWWALLLVVAALAWLVGTWRTTLSATLALALVGVMGLWAESLNTLSQVLAAVVMTLLVGVAIGILAARVDRVARMIRPVLDVMQTMPQFIYLIPVVALFGVGRVAAMTAAIVYALPAVVRITTQGLRQVDPSALEAARSLGAGPLQQLRQVQLPLARNALLLAVNQGVVLVLAVVIVGGLVGGGALGYDVVYGLQRGDLGVGMSAGVAIVCLGLMLDRITQPTAGRRKDQ